MLSKIIPFTQKNVPCKNFHFTVLLICLTCLDPWADESDESEFSGWSEDELRLIEAKCQGNEELEHSG